MQTGYDASAQRASSAPAGRLVWAVLAYACLPLGLVLWSQRPGVDWAWDLAMGLGTAAATIVALLPVLSARWWAGAQGGSALLRVIQRLHRDLAWLCAACVLLHVLGLLWLEPRTLDYLLLSAPGYMLAGLGAVLLMVALIVTSFARLKRRWAQPVWRRWHAAMSLGAVGLGLWHLLGAGFYFADAGAQAALLCLLGVPALIALCWHYRPPPVSARAPREVPRGSRRTAALAAVAVLLAVLAACLWWARAMSAAPASTLPYPCPAGRCL